MARLFAACVATVTVLSTIVSGCGASAPASTPASAPPPPTTAAALAVPAPAATSTKTVEPTKPAARPTAALAAKLDYPTKGRTISVIVPFAAGGSTDIAARLLAPLMEKYIGAPVEVVDKPGAATQVGNTELAKARPDGYTLGMVGFAAILISYLDPDRKATYTRKDFQTIAHYVVQDNVMFVKSDSPYKNIKDLVEAARVNPGQIKVGTAGLMSNTHIAALKLQQVANVKFSYVHFGGTAEGVTALMGGHIDAFSGSTGDIMSQYKAGTVRVLGTTGKEQSKFFPDVKTYASQGYDVYSVYSFGLVGPAGMPKEIVDLLTSSAKMAMQSDELKGKLAEMAMDVDYKDPAAFDAYWIDYETQVKPLIDLAKSSQ